MTPLNQEGLRAVEETPTSVTHPPHRKDRVMKIIKYPLRAAKISLDLYPFGFWLKPSFTKNQRLSESAKRNGEPIWYARWAWFQVKYSRWV